MIILRGVHEHVKETEIDNVVFYQQNARNEATSARDAGISMYTVGIGSGVDSSELTAIAGGSDQVIILNDFSELEGDSALQRLLYSMPSECRLRYSCCLYLWGRW